MRNAFLRWRLWHWLLVCTLLLGWRQPAAAQGDPKATRLEERYKAMLRSNPTEGLALDRLWKSHEEQGTTGDLLCEYQQQAASPDADAATLLIYGHMLKKTGQLDDAAQAYTRAAGMEAGQFLAHVALADLAVRRGMAEQAVEEYAAALAKLPPGDRRRADLLLKQGDALLSAGKADEAVRSWEKVVAESPNDIPLRRRLADACEKAGLLAEAAKQFEQITARGAPADKAAAWRELGRLREAQGQFDAARDALESGLTLVSRDNWMFGDLQTRLIHLYQRAGRAGELAVRWRAAAEQAPRDLGGYLRLEALAGAEGDARGQREALEKIVALNPRDRESTRKLAAVLAQAGERQRAGDLYDALLRQQPGNLSLILARAEVDVQAGQTEEAVRRVEARLAQSPADESVTTPALEFFLSHRLEAPAERLLRAEAARSPEAIEPALALAKHLFAHRRAEEARTVLEKLAARPGGPSDQTSRLTRVAETYREAGEMDDALRTWRALEQSQPDNPAPLLAEADLLRAEGSAAEAASVLERALTLSKTGDDQTAVEKKLFDILRTADGVNEPPAEVMPNPPKPRPVLGPMLARYVAGLTRKAQERNQAEDYVRLARWLAWARNMEGSLTAARQALKLEPESRAALGLAVGATTDLRQSELAEGLLARLIKIDPEHSDDATRQLANLKLAGGQTEEALGLFAQLQSRAPGSRTALADLALAQQRADQWLDAVQTWEQAYALPGGTPAQRAEVRRPLVAAYEHVGQYEQAMNTLGQAVDAQTDPPAKFDLFEQMSTLARQYGLEARLTAQMETRLARKPDDYFTLAALAGLRRDAGEAIEGYALLRKAHYSSPDPAQSLRALVREGEELGQVDQAVGDQRRLLALPGQGTVENMARLADLQEADQNPEEAAKTWDETVKLFPRDPAALTKAAAFFERTAQWSRARELASAALALDNSDLRAALHLAELDGRLGRTQDALADYEKVLDCTEPEQPGAPLDPPDELQAPFDPLPTGPTTPASFRLRMGLGRGSLPLKLSPERTGDAALRLDAVRGAAVLLAGLETTQDHSSRELRERWLDRWRKAWEAGSCNEPLTAFYFARDKEATMRLLRERLDRAAPTNGSLAGAYLLAGLRLGEYAPAGEWIWSAQGETLNFRLQALAAALDRYLSTGGKPEPGLIAGIFPPGADRLELLWDLARQFASLYWYAPAAELGERVLASKSGDRAATAAQVAEWELYIGWKDRALQALRIAVEEDTGVTLDSNVSPIFAAIRQYYLLLSPTERPAFAESYLRKLRARPGQPLPALLGGILLHGLAGDEAAARRDVDALLATRALADDFAGPSADTRRLSYLLSNGVQLQSWNLDAVAAYLWRQAWQNAGTFGLKTGEPEGTLAEIQRRLLGAEVGLAADPETARQLVADYVAANPPTGTAASTAGELLANNRYAAGIQILEGLCRVEPRDAEHWRSLFSAYEVAGEWDREERTLAGLFEGERELPEGLPRADFVCRWAAVREHNDDAAGACQVLEAERANAPGTLPVLMQLAQTYGRRQLYEQAGNIWREMLPLDPNATALLGLANAADKRGQRDAAIQILHDGLEHGSDAGRNEVVVRLVRLYLAAGRATEAQEITRDLLRERRTDPLREVAATYVASGQTEAARDLLRAAVLRAREPNAKYGLQQALVGLTPVTAADQRSFWRELAHLESIAKGLPALRNSLEAARYKLARAAGANEGLERGLRQRWQDGRGEYLAGERLAALYIDTKRWDRLGEVVWQFDHRPMLPDQLLFGLEKALVQAGQALLALPISERLCRRFPQNVDFAVQRVGVLWKSGQHAEAGRLLDQLADTAVLHDEIMERLALLALDLGDTARAQDLFTRQVRMDPFAIQSSGSFLELAKLKLAAGQRQEAEKLLQTAYRQDAVPDFNPLVDYLLATGQLDGDAATQMPLPDFPLSFHRRAGLLGAVYHRLVKDGRTAQGQELLLRHPAFLAEVPSVAAELCQNAPPQEKARLAASLQIALEQNGTPYPRLQRLAEALKLESEMPSTASVAGEAPTAAATKPTF